MEGAQHTWMWLARTLMLELHTAQQAVMVEQSLHSKDPSEFRIG
jgi:hypothetical protein